MYDQLRAILSQILIIDLMYKGCHQLVSRHFLLFLKFDLPKITKNAQLVGLVTFRLAHQNF
jgi:hypothetical protein